MKLLISILIILFSFKIQPYAFFNKNFQAINDTIPERLNGVTAPLKIWTKVEVDAQFPGGESEWTKYLTKKMRDNIDKLVEDNQSGTCKISFIIDTSGVVSEVQALNMKGSVLAKVGVDAIKKGPRWIPARHQDKPVVYLKEMPVTFTIQNK